MIKYGCDSCFTELETTDDLSGRQEVCPICRRTNWVPISKKDANEAKQAKQRQREYDAKIARQQEYDAKMARQQEHDAKMARYTRNTMDLQQAKESTKGMPSNDILCVISFLIPIVGLFIGVLLLTHKDAEDRQTGNWCLMCAGISFVICLFFMFLCNATGNF